MTDIDNKPQGTAVAPQGTAVAPQGTAVAPQGTAVAPQGTAVAPQGTAVAPQGTAVAPQGTAAAPQGTAAGSGTEANLYVQDDGTILKLYNPGFKCNAKVLEKVRGLKGKGFVVDLIDYGTKSVDGMMRDFELMQNYPLGAASKYDLKGNADAITRILVKTALCLKACHDAGFIHKDIKPANILIRDKKTWDCVLCDFGIADVLEKGGKVSTLQNRTPIYAAPEAYDPSNVVFIDGRYECTLTPASDYFSLGMTALALWFGEGNYRKREAELAIEKKNGNIKVSKDIPQPLNKIIRGLLVCDPARRWGCDEITRTMKGEDVPVYEGGLNIVFNGEKHQIAQTLPELATLMLKDPVLAKKYLYTGMVSKWLEKNPEVKIQVDDIVEKQFPKDETGGFLCALHVLNPLYDINLCCDPSDPDYAMTGESIGRKLNEAYEIYYGRFGGDANRMLKEWDSDCASHFRGSAIAYRLIKSFTGYSPKSYLVWVLSNKGSRFTEQIKWIRYCLDFDSMDNQKKAGPKDREYLEQTAMMKTIAGFGHKPTYGNIKESAGVRGWLAVQYHEDPNADLKPKYAYEKLLEQYLLEYNRLFPGTRPYNRFVSARSMAADTAVQAKKGAGPLVRRSLILRVLGLLLVGIPAIYLVISAIKLVITYPDVDVSNITFGWTFAIIGIVLGIILFVTDFGSLTGAIVCGLIASAILLVVVKLLGSYIAWIYAAVVIALVIMYLVMVVFAGRSGRINKFNGNPGFMELTLEPLYFAFNDEDAFTSSLDAYIDDSAIDKFKSNIKRRLKIMLIFVAVFWALMFAQAYFNKRVSLPDTMENAIQINTRHRGIIHD